MRAAAVFLTLLALLFATGRWAFAEPLEIHISGQVTSVDDLGNLLGGTVTVGMAYSAVFPFQSTSPDIEPDIRYGNYNFTPPGFSVAAGGIAVQALNPQLNRIYVTNAPGNPPYDAFDVVSSGFDSPGFVYMFAEAFFGDHTGRVFASDALPLTAPLLSAFDQSDFELAGYSPDLLSRFKFFGTIDTFSITAVPEPASLAVMWGASSFVLLRRKPLSR